MSIVNEVLGEDISGLANFDEEIKKKLIKFKQISPAKRFKSWKKYGIIY